MPEAARTLVKSPPELWAEVSDPTALARHLGAFGDIRITRLDPEVTVAWEGDRARGTVALEPTGWGTKVTVAAEPVASGAPEAAEEAAPVAEATATASAGRGVFARLFRRRPKAPPPTAVVVTPTAVVDPPAGAENLEPVDPATVLGDMLATLGAAHHRPFSRG